MLPFYLVVSTLIFCGRSGVRFGDKYSKGDFVVNFLVALLAMSVTIEYFLKRI